MKILEKCPYLLYMLLPLLIILILYLIDKIYKREYKKTIERCTYHVIGKVSENNYDLTVERSRRGANYRYCIVLKYIFTINGVQYEKKSTWQLRT